MSEEKKEKKTTEAHLLQYEILNLTTFYQIIELFRKSSVEAKKKDKGKETAGEPISIYFESDCIYLSGLYQSSAMVAYAQIPQIQNVPPLVARKGSFHEIKHPMSFDVNVLENAIKALKNAVGIKKTTIQWKVYSSMFCFSCATDKVTVKAIGANDEDIEDCASYQGGKFLYGIPYKMTVPLNSHKFTRGLLGKQETLGLEVVPMESDPTCGCLKIELSEIQRGHEHTIYFDPLTAKQLRGVRFRMSIYGPMVEVLRRAVRCISNIGCENKSKVSPGPNKKQKMDPQYEASDDEHTEEEEEQEKDTKFSLRWQSGTHPLVAELQCEDNGVLVRVLVTPKFEDETNELE